MGNYKYPGFDKLPEDSPIKLSLPLCDILHSMFGDRDFAYISAAYYPLELTELILYRLKYDRGIDVIEYFSKKYITMDTLCPIDTLLELWGLDKFNQMIEELQNIAEN